MADKHYQGQISLADFTTTAYLPANGTIVYGNRLKESGKALLQVGSANLSGAVTCTLQISVDGTYWATAQEDGTDITYSLDTTTPIVDIISGEKRLLWRLAITINSKTGLIDYYIKDVE